MRPTFLFWPSLLYFELDVNYLNPNTNRNNNQINHEKHRLCAGDDEGTDKFPITRMMAICLAVGVLSYAV